MKNSLEHFLKFSWAFFRLILSWNFFVAIGYLAAANGNTEQELRSKFDEFEVPYGRRLNYLLGYHFYLADLKRGYYGS